MEEKRIVYLEDSEENIATLGDVLKELNYKLELVKTASLAEKLLSKFEPHLFIVSMDVTSTDPSDLIQKIKKNKALKKVPFIFLSENFDEDVFFDEFPGADKKKSGFLKRPFEIVDCVDLVEATIGLPAPPKGVFPVSIGAQRDLINIRKENEELKVELSECKNKLAASSKQVTTEVSQIKNLSKDIDHLKKMNILRDEELNLLKKDLAKKTEEVEKSRKKMSDLKGEKDSEVARIKAEMEEIEKEREEDKEKHKKAQGALREFYKPKLAALNDLEEKVGGLEKEIEKARQEVDSKEAQLADLEKKLAETEKKLKSEKGFKDKLKKVLEEAD